MMQPMTDETPPVDLSDLAKKLLDLWQDQVAAVAADRDLADQMARLSAALLKPGQMPGAGASPGPGPHTMRNTPGDQPGGQQGDPTTAIADWWRTGMTAWSTALTQQVEAFKAAHPASAAPTSPQQGGQHAQPSPGHPASSRPSTAATASQPRTDDVEQLRRHLAELDARLAALEGPTDASTGTEPGRRQSGKPAGKSAARSAAKPKAKPAASPSASGAANTGTTTRRR